GTGKTAAFILPILQMMTEKYPRKIRTLVVTPTRELAAQIGESFSVYGEFLKFKHTVIFGGVKQGKQVQILTQGVDILVATPGRLLDLMNQNKLNLNNIEFFVLDEADRMLDMGFINDVKKIVTKLPKKRQTLFFSATMDQEVIKLSEKIIHNAVSVSVTPGKPAVERIIQKVFFVDKNHKDALLAQLLEAHHLSRVLVFVQMKHSANKVVKKLQKLRINSAAIHGNKSQSARTDALSKFKKGQIRVLVATDIAARGIDVSSISHVVNYDLPLTPETYVHRIGRTARAGTDGDAVSFCSAAERESLSAIEKMVKMTIPVERDHKFHSKAAETATGAASRSLAKRGRLGSSGRSNADPNRYARKPVTKSSKEAKRPGSWARRKKSKWKGRYNIKINREKP
ncbi:MAG: DEAD/DEAH box helicase, partial [Candidatus Pacebacteria bacterium]|nr:DEAD/DEAH box helicase [Candidatus Paceibacterota bacterium]